MKKLIFQVFECNGDRTHLHFVRDRAGGRSRHFPGEGIGGPERGDRRPRGGGKCPSSNILLGVVSIHSSQTLLDSGDTLTGCPRNLTFSRRRSGPPICHSGPPGRREAPAASARPMAARVHSLWVIPKFGSKARIKAIQNQGD